MGGYDPQHAELMLNNIARGYETCFAQIVEFIKALSGYRFWVSSFELWVYSLNRDTRV